MVECIVGYSTRYKASKTDSHSVSVLWPLIVQAGILPGDRIEAINSAYCKRRKEQERDDHASTEAAEALEEFEEKAYVVKQYASIEYP